MKFFTHLLVFIRFTLLSRQLQEIKRIIQALPVTAQRATGQLAMNEIDAASRTSLPYLHGSSTADVHRPWGDGASLAFQRARARIPQMKLRGLALWLAIVYQETHESPHPSMQALHREILGLLGQLKGTYANPSQLSAATP